MTRKHKRSAGRRRLDAALLNFHAAAVLTRWFWRQWRHRPASYRSR